MYEIGEKVTLTCISRAEYPLPCEIFTGSLYDFNVVLVSERSFREMVTELDCYRNARNVKS